MTLTALPPAATIAATIAGTVTAAGCPSDVRWSDSVQRTAPQRKASRVSGGCTGNTQFQCTAVFVCSFMHNAVRRAMRILSLQSAIILCYQSCSMLTTVSGLRITQSDTS
jgi:hypothetical protein